MTIWVAPDWRIALSVIFFWAAEYLRVYLWSSPLGKKAADTKRFHSFLFPEL